MRMVVVMMMKMTKDGDDKYFPRKLIIQARFFRTICHKVPSIK